MNKFAVKKQFLVEGQIKKRKGFTIIEVIITIGIIGIMISSMGIVINRQELVFNLDHHKLRALISRAKSLTMFGVFQEKPGSRFCGYGVEINASARRAVIFKSFSPVKCPPASFDGFRREPLSGELNELRLDRFLNFKESVYIFFIPPDPSVHIYVYDAQRRRIPTNSFTIRMINEIGNVRKINVNSAGLIDLL